VTELEFYLFSLMPYPHIPPGEELDSAWITLSNAHYDPVAGHRLYQEYLDQMVFAEQLGYDGVLVNEHHQTPYAVQPAPNLWAAYLAARTSRIRIGVIGNALPLHRNPLRVAEEIAMLDVLSGGRIISGHVRAMGAEYLSAGVDPTRSKGRFVEANELIVRAWTEPGPWAWHGEHFDIEYVNPWPRPLQQPHPPVWLPGSNSIETIELAARLRFPYMLTPLSFAGAKAAFDHYRRIAEDECGYTPAPNQLGRLCHTHVAETDAQARREAEPHVMWFFRNSLKLPPWQMLPPGYNDRRAVQAQLEQRASSGAKPFTQLTFDELIDQGYVIVGSPATVIERYEEMVERLGIGMVMSSGGHLGSMPDWLVRKNMQLLAETVFPRFRPPGGAPVWARNERAMPHTHAETAARFGPPQPAPFARLDGRGLVQTRLAQFDDAAAGDAGDNDVVGSGVGVGGVQVP
jgi:alkanesulfonate monooxygenase SsuD/methylene tetrahydromethanopterin reductase-like flavin-dependent oxidoreductase (luciferase family)